MTHPIEPGIRALVDALNGLDFAGTVYSCEGHFDGPQDERFLPTAYVTFGVSDVKRFVPLHEKMLALNDFHLATDFRLTYDCVLGRYTLSIWAGASFEEAAEKRAVVDRAAARLTQLISGCAVQASFGDPEGGARKRAPHPCGESVPPCTLVIPPKELICPFVEMSERG